MIKFGTDGWRAKIGEEFTFDNVKIVTQALVDYLKEKNLAEKGIAIGYDNRFLSPQFAKTAAEACANLGLKTYLMSYSVPSPVLSFTVKDLGLAAGIMITASHNPPEWNGFKVKESFGGSAMPETTKGIEEKVQSPKSKVQNKSQLQITKYDPNPPYFKHVLNLIDLNLIKKSKTKIIVDSMHGSGIGYLKELLGDQIIEINSNLDPLFGGVNPEPLPINLIELIELCKESSLNGIAIDGDADRLAGMDINGNFINTHNVFSLLLKHLIENRKMSENCKGIAKTFNLTRLIEKQCAKYKLKLFETPIGFKHIANLILKGEIIMGGEESGGYGVSSHLPERDGVFNTLLLLELMAIEKKGLREILNGIMDELGHYSYDRMDVHIEKAQEVVKKMLATPPAEFGGMEVIKTETLDGVKLNFKDESWILFRASGTEPLLRIYAEARTPEQVKLLLAEGHKLIS